MKRITTIVAAAAVAAGIGMIVAPGSAVAASGDPILLGHGNTATHYTSITNPTGIPLALLSKSGYAPLAVNSTVKVTNLDADLLDGYSSGSLAKTFGKTGTIVGDAPGLAAHCPTGTVVTGGGGLADGGLLYSGPDTDNGNGFTKNSWLAVGYDSSFGDALSFAECYSPSGDSIPGSITPNTKMTVALSKGARMYLQRMDSLKHAVAARAAK